MIELLKRAVYLFARFARGISRYLKSIFYSKNKPRPVYAYIFFMLVLISVMVILRILHATGQIQPGESFSDTLILGMCAFVATWAGIITLGDIKKPPKG